MPEFTGERLVPGQVDIDLLNEHMARYAFAARLAGGKRVLDAGCGTGYGSAELAKTALAVTGADIAPEALSFAREHYPLANLHFEQAACGALPHPDACFDLVVAFEVIEHLADWREFLLEARRVLAPSGEFLVSTPNKLYYTESRGREGVNPFHVHEFEFEEFRAELAAVFPNVALYLENHVEGIGFQPCDSGGRTELRIEPGEFSPSESHFFVAICSQQLHEPGPAFVYIPRAGNVLRERGRHIGLLEQELETKNQWLKKAAAEHQDLLAAHRTLEAQLEASNQWAESLNRELEERRNRVLQLQDEIARTTAGYEAKIRELEADIRSKAQWAIDTETRLNVEIRKQVEELGRAVEALHDTEKQLEQRTAWALRLEAEAQSLRKELDVYRASRWVRLGRKLGLGPDLPPN